MSSSLFEGEARTVAHFWSNVLNNALLEWEERCRLDGIRSSPPFGLPCVEDQSRIINVFRQSLFGILIEKWGIGLTEPHLVVVRTGDYSPMGTLSAAIGQICINTQQLRLPSNTITTAVPGLVLRWQEGSGIFVLEYYDASKQPGLDERFREVLPEGVIPVDGMVGRIFGRNIAAQLFGDLIPILKVSNA